MKKLKNKIIIYGIAKCKECNKTFTKKNPNQKFCSKECYKEKVKKWHQTYRATQLGFKNYSKATKKYQQSEKGKVAFRRYRKTDGAKESKKKYNKKEKGKKVIKKSRKKYAKSGKGKETLKKALDKYQKTNHGKLTRKKYRQSEQGKKLLSISRKKRMRSDPLFKLKSNVRSRLWMFLKANNMRKTNKTFKIVGCTPEFLKEYLEKQFKPWMNWKNHTRKGWHIDHITPLDSAKTLKALEKLMHYTNLRPLRGTENMSKGNRII